MSHLVPDRYRPTRLAHRAAEARRRVAAPLGCRAWEQPPEREPGARASRPAPPPAPPVHLSCTCPTGADPWERCAACQRAATIRTIYRPGARPVIQTIYLHPRDGSTTAA